MVCPSDLEDRSQLDQKEYRDKVQIDSLCPYSNLCRKEPQEAVLHLQCHLEEFLVDKLQG